MLHFFKKNDSCMTGFSLSKSMYRKHASNISLLAYESVTSSAIKQKYFVLFQVSLIYLLITSAIQVIISFWIFHDFIWAILGSFSKWSCKTVSISAKLFRIAIKLPSLENSSVELSPCPLNGKPCVAQTLTAWMTCFRSWRLFSYRSSFSAS